MTTYPDFAAGSHDVNIRRSEGYFQTFTGRDGGAVESPFAISISETFTTSATFVTLATRRIYVPSSAVNARFRLYAEQIGGTAGSLRFKIGLLTGTTLSIPVGARAIRSLVCLAISPYAGTPTDLVVEGHRGDGSQLTIDTHELSSPPTFSPIAALYF